MKNDKFYITTPIYYISGDPHIGHLYTTVAADIISRFKNICGYDVLFSTGSDENSLKVIKAANKKNISVQQYVDLESKKWKDFFENYDIKFTRFIRTTDTDHKELVSTVIQKLYDKGYIYKGKYEGWYCVDCETFWIESDAKENICPNCGRDIQWISESNYFFKLSHFQKQLIDFYDNNPDVIEPSSRYNETMSMLKIGLKDLSISRGSIEWGIKLPFDNTQVTYVWIDALLNYLTVPEYINDREKFAKFWPADLHLMSKDIIRFHCIIWPALLLALDLPLPKKIFVHGWWLTSGEKMSKSKGNVVDPNEVVSDLSEKTGLNKNNAIEVLRLFMFREASFGEDAVFSDDRFYSRYNFDLANDLGNLINRVYSMSHKYFNYHVTKQDIYSNDYLLQIEKAVSNYKINMDKYNLQDALDSLWNLIRFSNKLIEDSKPWILFKNKEIDKLNSLIYSLLDVIRIVSIMLSPFMPKFSKEVLSSLGERNINIKDCVYGLLKDSIVISDLGIIFPRIKKESENTTSKTNDDNKIDINEFKKIDLRIAEVIEAKKIEESEKLILIKVRVDKEIKQIVAGIGKHYSAESLIGKKIAIINNLKPTKLLGYASQGMLLAASDDDSLSVLTIDKDIASGTIIK